VSGHLCLGPEASPHLKKKKKRRRKPNQQTTTCPIYHNKKKKKKPFKVLEQDTKTGYSPRTTDNIRTQIKTKQKEKRTK
jgi:hypothetical protein